MVKVWIALPVSVLTGFASGMVGVSGGSFLVPLTVVACSVPMHLAVGTAFESGALINPALGAT